MANNRSSQQILFAAWRRFQSRPQAVSLRSFAQRLKVSPSYLSKILAGKAKIPKTLLEVLPKQMDMDAATKRQLLQALRREALKQAIGNTSEGSEDIKAKSQPSALDAYELGMMEAEWLLGRWYRTAILDLTTVKDFNSDPEWIAKRLGIARTDVQTSLVYLKDAGLLQETREGSLKKTYLHLRFPSTTSKAQFRQHHISQMQRAIAYLEKQTTPKDFQKRLIFGVTVACNPARLEEVKADLHTAIYQAAQKLSDDDCEEVYQINLQLFPQSSRK